MVGCIAESAGIPQLFIAELQDSHVQFGYIGENLPLIMHITRLITLTGICSSIPGKDMVCKSAIGTPPADLSKSLSLPADVVQHVLALQRSVSLALPALSSMLYFLGVIAFLTVYYIANTHSTAWRRWISATRILLWGSVATAFTAAYSLNFSISVMEVVVPSQPSTGLAVTRGQSLQILQWMVFCFTALFVGVTHQITHRYLKEERTGVLPMNEMRIPRKPLSAPMEPEVYTTMALPAPILQPPMSKEQPFAPAYGDSAQTAPHFPSRDDNVYPPNRRF
jgi:hypothetical protein